MLPAEASRLTGRDAPIPIMVSNTDSNGSISIADNRLIWYMYTLIYINNNLLPMFNLLS